MDWRSKLKKRNNEIAPGSLTPKKAAVKKSIPLDWRTKLKKTTSSDALDDYRAALLADAAAAAPAPADPAAEPVSLSKAGGDCGGDDDNGSGSSGDGEEATTSTMCTRAQEQTSKKAVVKKHIPLDWRTKLKKTTSSDALEDYRAALLAAENEKTAASAAKPVTVVSLSKAGRGDGGGTSSSSDSNSDVVKPLKNGDTIPTSKDDEKDTSAVIIKGDNEQQQHVDQETDDDLDDDTTLSHQSQSNDDEEESHRDDDDTGLESEHGEVLLDEQQPCVESDSQEEEEKEAAAAALDVETTAASSAKNNNDDDSVAPPIHDDEQQQQQQQQQQTPPLDEPDPATANEELSSSPSNESHEHESAGSRDVESSSNDVENDSTINSESDAAPSAAAAADDNDDAQLMQGESPEGEGGEQSKVISTNINNNNDGDPDSSIIANDDEKGQATNDEESSQEVAVASSENDESTDSIIDPAEQEDAHLQGQDDESSDGWTNEDNNTQLATDHQTAEEAEAEDGCSTSSIEAEVQEEEIDDGDNHDNGPVDIMDTDQVEDEQIQETDSVAAKEEDNNVSISAAEDEVQGQEDDNDQSNKSQSDNADDEDDSNATTASAAAQVVKAESKAAVSIDGREDSDSVDASIVEQLECEQGEELERSEIGNNQEEDDACNAIVADTQTTSEVDTASGVDSDSSNHEEEASVVEISVTEEASTASGDDEDGVHSNEASMSAEQESQNAGAHVTVDSETSEDYPVEQQIQPRPVQSPSHSPSNNDLSSELAATTAGDKTPLKTNYTPTEESKSFKKHTVPDVADQLAWQYDMEDEELVAADGIDNSNPSFEKIEATTSISTAAKEVSLNRPVRAASSSFDVPFDEPAPFDEMLWDEQEPPIADCPNETPLRRPVDAIPILPPAKNLRYDIDIPFDELPFDEPPSPEALAAANFNTGNVAAQTSEIASFDLVKEDGAEPQISLCNEPAVLEGTETKSTKMEPQLAAKSLTESVEESVHTQQVDESSLDEIPCKDGSESGSSSSLVAENDTAMLAHTQLGGESKTESRGPGSDDDESYDEESVHSTANFVETESQRTTKDNNAEDWNEMVPQELDQPDANEINSQQDSEMDNNIYQQAADDLVKDHTRTESADNHADSGSYNEIVMQDGASDNDDESEPELQELDDDEPDEQAVDDQSNTQSEGSRSAVIEGEGLDTLNDDTEERTNEKAETESHAQDEQAEAGTVHDSFSSDDGMESQIVDEDTNASEGTDNEESAHFDAPVEDPHDKQSDSGFINNENRGNDKTALDSEIVAGPAELSKVEPASEVESKVDEPSEDPTDALSPIDKESEVSQSGSVADDSTDVPRGEPCTVDKQDDAHESEESPIDAPSVEPASETESDDHDPHPEDPVDASTSDGTKDNEASVSVDGGTADVLVTVSPADTQREDSENGSEGECLEGTTDTPTNKPDDDQDVDDPSVDTTKEWVDGNSGAVEESQATTEPGFGDDPTGASVTTVAEDNKAEKHPTQPSSEDEEDESEAVTPTDVQECDYENSASSASQAPTTSADEAPSDSTEVNTNDTPKTTTDNSLKEQDVGKEQGVVVETMPESDAVQETSGPLSKKMASRAPFVRSSSDDGGDGSVSAWSTAKLKRAPGGRCTDCGPPPSTAGTAASSMSNNPPPWATRKLKKTGVNVEA